MREEKGKVNCNTGPTEGAGITVSTGSKEASGAGDKVCASWEFLPVDRQG